MTQTSMTRLMLEKAFPGQPRTIAEFERNFQALYDVQQVTSATVAATDALQDASFVTLSANGASTNERILSVAGGLSITDTGTGVTLATTRDVAAVSGGYQVTFNVAGSCELVLPVSGQLATRAGVETFSNKTLDAPKFSGLGDYANDAAAAAGGVAIGQAYRNGSILMLRVT